MCNAAIFPLYTTAANALVMEHWRQIVMMDLAFYFTIECAGELKCNNLVIATNNDERTIEKDGYKIDLVPLFNVSSV